MHDDDAQVGHILSRRELIALLGAGGAALLGGPGVVRGAAVQRPGYRLPKCIVRPRQSEGPYFVETISRSDIRSDPADGSIRDGAPLSLRFVVSRLDAQRCEPMEGVLVDVWQCDASGVYSAFEDIGGQFDTRGQQFLRGHQVTGADGTAHFTTIYPGWYPGRAVHIHFKLRTNPRGSDGHEFTSQVYFDDELSDRVLARAPYTADPGRRIRNADDGLFPSGGDELLLDVTKDEGGYHAVFDVGLQIG